jgi:hypothetical protein
MMLCLALRNSAERVYERALRQFTVQEINEAFSAARGLALPSQLRRALRASGHNLHAEFCDLLPERPRWIKLQRWNPRRVALLLLGIAAATYLVGFVAVVVLLQDAWTPNLSDSKALDVLGGDVSCAGGGGESLWLSAQSVPSASLVPCEGQLPPGWRFHEIRVKKGKSVFVLDHDQAGASALIATLTPTCDTTAAAQAAPDWGDGTTRYFAPASTSHAWYEVFRGGCVTVDLRTASQDSNVNDRLPDEASQALHPITRAALVQGLAARSHGRLHL